MTKWKTKISLQIMASDNCKSMAHYQYIQQPSL